MKFCVLVMDSVGVGALPDAGKFGDSAANTIGNIAKTVGKLELPNLGRLGMGNLTGIDGTPATQDTGGGYGKLNEQSAGKDTSVGHWELMGIKTDTPFHVYPDGFPPELIDAFAEQTGYNVIGNKAASGTEIIKELGEKQLADKSLIVYTSADSVFQIAAHEDLFPVEELNGKIGSIARKLCDEYGVTRVITRPYIGEYPDFKRTANRKDISVPPGEKTACDYLTAAGIEVVGIGKTASIFADQGFDRSIKTKTNMHGVDETIAEFKNGNGNKFIFTNLVEFDSEYGHRRNPEGYAQALKELDERIPELLESMGPDDIIVFTADHGNDPTAPGTDHTREYVPCLVAGPGVKPGVDIGIRESFADVAATIVDYFGIKAPDFGKSFLNEVKN